MLLFTTTRTTTITPLTILITVTLGLITKPVIVVSDAPPHPHPYRILQPDGTQTPPLRLKGSFTHHWEEDLSGNLILTNATGYKVYATRDDNGDIIPSDTTPVDATTTNTSPISHHLRISPRDLPPHPLSLHNPSSPSPLSHRRRQLITTTGQIKNLVVLVRFADHVDRPLPTPATIDQLFNARHDVANDMPDNHVTPTGSVNNVYRISSYDKMSLDSVVLPWVTVNMTERDASDGDAGRTTTLWKVMHEALRLVEERDDGLDLRDFDVDGDGEIDAITFLHSGYDACFGATDCFGTDQMHRIWSHKRGMDTWTSKDGITVSEYNIAPSLYKYCGNETNHIGIISHELGHYMGISDLYDRKSGGCGIGFWGLMGSGAGVDHTGFYPPIMSAFSKEQLNFIQPTPITRSGTYNLTSSSLSPLVYKISAGYPSGEYLLIENRQPSSYDSLIPHGGLAIWHIDAKAKYHSAMDINAARGYPGMTKNWPRSGDHYSVALIQADGNYDLEKNVNCGDDRDLFHAGGVNRLGPSERLSDGGPHPNTDSYQGGRLIRTNHVIANISESGEVMTFDVLLGEEVVLLEEEVDIESGGIAGAGAGHPCEDWCDHATDADWELKCTWKDTCAGCQRCRDDDDAEITTKIAATRVIECKSYCIVAKDVNWERKCLLEHCAGCENCL